MFTLTDAAAKHLTELLDGAEAPDKAAVRLARQSGGLAIYMDQEQPGDQTFDHDGRTVLVMEEGLCAELGDTTLDLESTDDGPALALR